MELSITTVDLAKEARRIEDWRLMDLLSRDDRYGDIVTSVNQTKAPAKGLLALLSALRRCNPERGFLCVFANEDRTFCRMSPCKGVKNPGRLGYL